jgi:hypothetical protein
MDEIKGNLRYPTNAVANSYNNIQVVCRKQCFGSYNDSNLNF